MNVTAPAWRTVATLDDLWEGEMLGVEAGGKAVLLVNLEGEIYAYDDHCPHLGTRLSEGSLEGAILTCSAHEWVFDCRLGKGVNPARACLRPVDVRVDGELILLEVDEGPTAERRDGHDAVGPVLQATPLGRAVVAAIERCNDEIEVRDEGAYLRVRGQRVCRVSSAEIEAEFGQSVTFPGDLEVVMSSFSGLVAMSEAGAVWWRSSEPPPELPS